MRVNSNQEAVLDPHSDSGQGDQRDRAFQVKRLKTGLAVFTKPKNSEHLSELAAARPEFTDHWLERLPAAPFKPTSPLTLPPMGQTSTAPPPKPGLPNSPPTPFTTTPPKLPLSSLTEALWKKSLFLDFIPPCFSRMIGIFDQSRSEKSGKIS